MRSNKKLRVLISILTVFFLSLISIAQPSYAANPVFNNLELPSLKSFDLKVQLVSRSHLKFTFTAEIATTVNPVKQIFYQSSGPLAPKGNGLLGKPCKGWPEQGTGVWSKEDFSALGNGLNKFTTSWISYYESDNQFWDVCPGEYGLFSDNREVPSSITIIDIANHEITYGLYSGSLNGNYNYAKVNQVPFLTSNLWKEELSTPNCKNLFAFNSKYYFAMCEGPSNFTAMIANAKTTITASDLDRAPLQKDLEAAEARAAEARAAEARAAEARAAEARAAEARAAEARAAEARAADKGKKTITCSKGSKIKRVTNFKPVCPRGYKKV
jgi:hypothetical protein